ncbi:MMPL family transporter [Nocardioides lianchengensis]|uniref:Putative drug exporter of the RND superfamily n=1 Tax=Nocardioides lianchengensis TaxID=1045774 RepID=A0A1G6N243_9ACTN|nr:MMPL family transporter [Nocardioides lianchengensis]NYG10628.1 RND superfamily putative drug exporter [Nocardioides lianchengensis]SDC61892.1 putative drug exporter of the RND superfamily [Nocardioides lianchengensis]
MTNPLTSVPIRAARWSAAHPWRAVLGWLALVAVAVGLAMMVPTHEASDADYRLGESGRADQLVEQAGLDDPDSELVLVTGQDAAAMTAAAAELTDGLAGLDDVAGVAEPQWSPDRTALLLAVRLALDHGDDADPLVAVTDRVAAEHPDLRIRQSGDLTLDAAIDERVAEDLGSAELISLPITLVLMLVAFGALVAAGLPVLLAATSVAATIGISAPLSHLVPFDDTVASMIVLIGMAVGVDYSLFYLKREREERAKGRSTIDAVEIAAQTSGHSILVSGGAVIAAMAGLFLVGDSTFNSLAVGSILVVAIAVLGSITVLPALLGGLGHRVDRPRVPLLWRLNARIGRGGISRRLLGPVVAHPVAALALAGTVVVALAVPALGMKTHQANLETLPASIPEVQTMRDVTAAFPSEGTTAEVVVRAGADDADDVRAALEQLADDAVATGAFVASGSDVEVSDDGRTSVLELAMPFAESDERVDEALRDLRTDLVPAAVDVPGAEAVVGGGAAESLDFVERLQERLPLVIGFVLLLTLIIMATTFRSLPVALVSTALNLGSVGVAFGLMTLVFQHGWFESLLGFESSGFVIDWLPLFVLVVLVGLSMDYHVFVVSRVREYVDQGLPTRVAVQRGVADTAGVVTSAAAVMVSVFAIFATLSMLEMKMMGVGLSAAILLDATLVRLVLLPAALVLLGERAWWPSRPTPPRGEPVVETDRAFAEVGQR